MCNWRCFSFSCCCSCCSCSSFPRGFRLHYNLEYIDILDPNGWWLTSLAQSLYDVPRSNSIVVYWPIPRVLHSWVLQSGSPQVGEWPGEFDCSSRKIRELFAVRLSFSAFTGRVLHFVYRIIAYFMTLSTSSTLGVCVWRRTLKPLTFTWGCTKDFYVIPIWLGEMVDWVLQNKGKTHKT